MRSQTFRQRFQLDSGIHVPPMLTIPKRPGKSLYPIGLRWCLECPIRTQSCLGDCPGIAYNDSFGGEAEKPLLRYATECSDDHGCSGNPEILAASLSLPDGRWDSG